MGLHSENWWLTTTSQRHFFALHHFYLGPRPWCLVIVSKLRFLCSRLCCQDLHRLERQLWHLASTFSTLAPVRWAKTSAAPKTSKNTTAWWPASHWKKLAMKCQISNEKSQIFPNSNLDRLQKLSATYNFAASLFCTQSPFKIILRPASWWLSQSCDSCAPAFAAEISAQMGQKTCTVWKKHFGTLLLQLQQSHPCELARLGWLPTISYHWPWNVKSTMRKDRSSQKQNKPGSSRENCWLPTTLQLQFFPLRNLYLGPF